MTRPPGFAFAEYYQRIGRVMMFKGELDRCAQVAEGELDRFAQVAQASGTDARRMGRANVVDAQNAQGERDGCA